MSLSMITKMKNYKEWKQYKKVQFNDKFIYDHINEKTIINEKQYENIQKCRAIYPKR